ncbi:MAG: tetratricopeptide repeat protein [Porphyromonas sp.]|nr:tetratricopeptide repeat protein [Porphyromonas sp.]
MAIENKNQENEITTQEAINKGEKFIEKNINKILYVLLGVIVIAFGIWAYIKYVKQPGDMKASEEMFQAEDLFMNGEDSTALAGNGFLAVAKERKGTKAANLAHAYAGICYYDMGQYEKALEELKKFKAKESMVAPSIKRLMGDCYVQLNKLSEAADLFEQAAEDADNDAISPSCLLKAGRVYEELKQYDKALEAYKKIKETYYTAPESQMVEADIIRVEALK